MGSWNVVWVKAREYELLNGSQTAVYLSRTSKFPVAQLMSRMEELGVPVAYSGNLKEVIFTRSLPSRTGTRNHGDYVNSRIRMASGRDTVDVMDRVFVHELAHHVDDQEDVTGDGLLEDERKRRWKHMPDRYARKNAGEYLAVGFEYFYCGTEEERAQMKRKNPRLYRTIASLHRRFSRR